MEGAAWIGIFLDVDSGWWQSGEGKDLYVRLSGAESTPGSGLQATWAVFARPGADANGEQGPMSYARYVAGTSERRLARMAERHGYTRCRLGDVRFFAGWQSEIRDNFPDDWEAAGSEVAEADDGSLTGSMCSKPIIVGDAPRYVLIHIRRDGEGVESWRWDEHPDLPAAVDFDDEAIEFITTGGGMVFGLQENEDGTQESFSRSTAEDDEFCLPGFDHDVLSDSPGPTIDWFGFDLPRRPRPRLTQVEEIALGNRIVQATSIISVSDDGIDGGGHREDSSPDDIAELNWGLVNGRTRVYSDWSVIELPGEWRERIDREPDFWSQYLKVPSVRAPWNAVVQYDPPGEASYRAMYFLARLGIPSGTEELRVNQDELPALVLCLAIGTLEAIRNGAVAPEVFQRSFRPMLWWLSNRVPSHIVDLLEEATGELDPEVQPLQSATQDTGEARPTAVPDQELIDDLVNRMRSALAQLPVPAWRLFTPDGE